MRFLVLTCVFIVVSCGPKPVETPVATRFRPQAGNPAPRVAAYCLAQHGRKVGNGECWTLADEAFKSAGTRRPGKDMRVWGRVVNPAKRGDQARRCLGIPQRVVFRWSRHRCRAHGRGREGGKPGWFHHRGAELGEKNRPVPGNELEDFGQGESRGLSSRLMFDQDLLLQVFPELEKTTGCQRAEF